MNRTEVWSSDNADLASESVPCRTITPHDLNTTITASQVIIACGTALFYLVILTLGILGVWFRSCARLCSSQGTFFVFLIGALLASVNVFTNSDNLEVKVYFRSFTVSIIGIAFALFGSFRFFSLPEEGANQQTLGDQQPSMGGVIGVITFPLFLLEAVLLVMTLTKEVEDATDPILWKPIIADKSAFLLQKPIQVGIYLYLRSTTPRMEYKENAEFYFRILSFFNLIEWLDSQVNVDNDVQLSEPIISKLDAWFNVFVVGYKALIIDYRLLCCLLFLEHSVEIANGGRHNDLEAQGPNEVRNINVMTPRDRRKMHSGFFVGCLCLTAPVFSGIYYLRSLHINASVQLFAIVVNSVILVFGACLLRMNNLEEEETKESLGVKIMVCCLGAVGFICWLVTAAIAGYWAATAADRKDMDKDLDEQSYMSWNAAKFVVRGLTAAFFMYLFMKVNARALPIQNRTTTMNYFVVPVVMLGMLSMILESLLDQYAGTLESKLRCEIKEESLKILLEAGPPMYLGFLIHLFLHVFIIWLNLGKRAENDSEASYSSYNSCDSQVSSGSSYASFTDPETTSHESEHSVPAVTIPFPPGQQPDQ